MRLINRERLLNMSENERQQIIDNIMTSDLTTDEKTANLLLLQNDVNKHEIILKQIEEGASDISDMKGH